MLGGVLVHGGLRRSSGGAGDRHLDATAGPEILRAAQVVELHQSLHAGVVALGDLGEGFARFHGVDGVHRGGACPTTSTTGSCRGCSGHLDAATGPEVLWAAQVVELHQSLHAGAVALGDLGEGLAWFHGVVAAATTAAGAASCRSGHLNAATGPEVLRAAQVVELHQALHAGAVALSDFREGFTGLHHNLSGQARQGQQQGQGECGSGAAAHGAWAFGWRHHTGLGR